MASRSKRWGQFSGTPGERVPMCSCISVGPSSAAATGPSAVSTIVPVLWSSVAIRRGELEGRDELALDGIDKGASLEGDEHLRGVAFGDLALDRHDAASLGWHHRQRAEESSASTKNVAIGSTPLGDAYGPWLGHRKRVGTGLTSARAARALQWRQNAI